MASKIQKRISHFFISLFIGLIVFSFAFTGYESAQGTPDVIAKIGGIPVKAQEYQRAYSRQYSLYQKMLGKDSLTRQDIKKIQLKENVLNGLIQQKLTLHFAEDLGIRVSGEEMRKSIKEMPYWQTNKQFDLNKYKRILAYNRLSPKDFELDTKDQLKREHLQNFFEKIPLSKKYLEDSLRFKNMRLVAHIVEINRNELRSSLPISSQEIKTYLSQPNNQAKAKSLFSRYRPSLTQPEEVKASHILVRIQEGKEKEARKKIEKIAQKLTVSNFKKMAKKYTDEPSGKQTGGELGWFGRRQMTPKFEEVAFKLKKGEISSPFKTPFGYHVVHLTGRKKEVPATFEKFKNKMAKELIQKGKTKELNDLFKDLSQRTQKALKAKDFKTIEKLSRKYSFAFKRGESINKLEGHPAIDQNSLKKIFSTDIIKNPVHSFPDSFKITLLRLTPPKEKKKKLSPLKELEREEERAISKLSENLQKSILMSYQKNIKVKIFEDRIP